MSDPAGGEAAGAERGSLVLVPNALDLGDLKPPPLESVLPLAVIRRAAGLLHWIVEDAKSARAFLKRVQAIERWRCRCSRSAWSNSRGQRKAPAR